VILKMALMKIRQEADRLNCCVEDLKVNLDYQEDIAW